ncbi:MAG: tyrosine-type recombinase/integrase [Akkermansia sp.]|nr:tyrosine-type recombinase/integrase [Akkermansia sp.]
MNVTAEMEQALREAGLTHLQAVRLALELVELSGARRLRGDGCLNRCRRVILLGAQQQREERRSVSFERAAEASLQARAGRRPRTVSEIRGICRRLMRQVPTLARRRIAGMNTQDCVNLLQSVFPTPRQRVKARAILHAVFAHAVRQGWCPGNPVEQVWMPLPGENEIRPLRPAQLQTLLRLAREPVHRPCMAALGVMLWCGVRPAEAARLGWEDIDWEERVLVLRPRHSKTGGCRHVPLRPVVVAWLQESGPRAEGALCPPDWQRRWRRLREAAALMPWQQDVLRHTFASYHLKAFHNLAWLQAEMGHRSPALLQTRYLSMRGVTAEGAELFWQVGGLWRRAASLRKAAR